MSQEREPHNSFEKSATFYLEAANLALLSGQPRLAIYLFRAAFETESAYKTIVSNQIIEGLRKAWDLACELGDRSTAESIYSDLGTFNNHEQNEQAVIRLQTLAMNQLEDMGITENDLEHIAGALAHGFMSAETSDLFDSLKSMLEQLEVTPSEEFIENEQIARAPHFSLPDVKDSGFSNYQDKSDPEFSGHPGEPEVDASAEPGTNLMPDESTEPGINPRPGENTEPGANSGSGASTGSGTNSGSERLSPQETGLARISRQLREFRDRKNEVTSTNQLNYQTLAGYENAMQQMQEYGFLSVASEQQRDFIERAAALHGLPRLSLNGTFLFIGSSREDVSLFAHATASEIGLPMIHVLVERDSHGNGIIKLSGPFKRALFGGPPDLMDLATPCIVLIENIDNLQQMFLDEQMAIQRSGGKPRGIMPGMGRSMQVEIGGYLRALRQKPGMVTMATAGDMTTLKEPLRSLLGPINRIEIYPPTSDERLELLQTFASEHPSFAELEINQVVHYSEGMSRNALVMAVHSTVEQAYRESLRTGTYNKVSLGDVLVKLASVIDHSSPIYKSIEDEAVLHFLKKLESQDMLSD